jgi:serine/threonine-protein kinase
MTTTDKSVILTARPAETTGVAAAGRRGGPGPGSDAWRSGRRAHDRPLSRGPSLPLAKRFLLLAVALIGIPLAVAVGVTAWWAQQVSSQSVRDALESAHIAREQFDRLRARQLRLIARLITNDPAFVAYVAEGDAASTADLLAERRQSLGCDFAIVLDRGGRLIARTDRLGATGTDLSSDPLVAEAMHSGEATGTWRDGDRLFSAVAAPLLSGTQTLEGVFVAGFALDDAVALDLKRMTGTEVCFIAADSTPARAMSSTLGASGDVLASAIGPALPRAFGGARAMLPRVWLERRAWGARIEPLLDASGAAVGAVVTLASLDAALAPYRRIEGVLVAVGLFAMLGAFAASWVATRRLSGPLERLAAAAESARKGQLDVPIEEAGRDEVGRLARAFRSLLAELREEREMAAFLAALSRSLADAPSEAPPQGSLIPGSLLGGRFELLAVLGAGGMGVVYRARDREIQDVVALKTLRPDHAGPEELEQLKSELRLARRITHRHVVRVYDFGQVDGVPFISMEYVEGVTLRALLRAGVPPLPVSLRIARQVAAGLEAAHQIGVVHYDLKPENVVFEPGGSAKLMDFGIARATRREVPDEFFSGTLGYAAPEVMEGRDSGVASDVFSFGVMLQELLTGRRPWSGADPKELVYRILNDPPAPLATASAAPGARGVYASPALARIVARCLARDPAERFANASALLAALDSARLA